MRHIGHIRFEQYEHLAYIGEAIKNNPELSSTFVKIILLHLILLFPDIPFLMINYYKCQFLLGMNNSQLDIPHYVKLIKRINQKNYYML